LTINVGDPLAVLTHQGHTAFSWPLDVIVSHHQKQSLPSHGIVLFVCIPSSTPSASYSLARILIEMAYRNSANLLAHIKLP
jgi:hypothetical protein